MNSTSTTMTFLGCLVPLTLNSVAMAAESPRSGFMQVDIYDKMELVSEKKQDRRMRWAFERLTAANYHSLLVERVA